MYAQTSARRARQITGDLAVLVWCGLWLWAGRTVHGLVLQLAEPARALQRTATDFGAAMTEAGTTVGDIPFAGEQLRGAFGRVAGVVAEASAAGAQFETTVARLALALALVTVLGPSLGLGIPWVVGRVRFARRATAARALVDSEADLDLFALRALANRPLPRLTEISPDPVEAWRRGDSEVVRALAALELRSIGLRPVHGPDGEVRAR